MKNGLRYKERGYKERGNIEPKVKIYDPYELFEVKGDCIRLKETSSRLEDICKEKEVVDLLKINSNFNLNILIRYFSTNNNEKSYSIIGHYNFKNNLKKPYFNFYPMVGHVLLKYLKEFGIDSTFKPLKKEYLMLTDDQRTIKLGNKNSSFLYLDEQQLLSSDNSIFNILKIIYFSPIYNKMFSDLLLYELNKNIKIMPAIKKLSTNIKNEKDLRKEYNNAENFEMVGVVPFENKVFIRYINKTLTKDRIDNILNYDEVHRIC